MPHVVVEGDVDLVAWAEAFEPLLVRRGGDVLRADAVYVAKDGRTALVEALAIEAGRKLPFYVKIARHDRGSATVRIDPLTHPERSDGVREIVALVGEDLLEHTAGAVLGATNLVLPSAR
ncbi:MAG: hypothetical protein JRG76_12385 [Deltaproteobacteria bacterium]|nr:hypothetical protein [Deltaproteobacteria bacterium]MBW2415296.1 hypothetical protein [Deltaproteobacteria bacterium]